MQIKVNKNRILVYYPGGYNYYCDYSTDDKAKETMKEILKDAPSYTVLENSVTYGKFRRF